MKISRSAAAGLLLSAYGCLAYGFQGRVVGVTDGDTVTVLDDSNQQYKIRVAGIDAPEKKQPFGQKSKENLASLVFNRSVEIVGNKKDRYGRTIAKVMVSDLNCRDRKCEKLTDAGLQQVASGLAWWYKKYQKEQSPDDRAKYEQAETTARSRRLGLWTDPEPMPPWDWRHRKH